MTALTWKYSVRLAGMLVLATPLLLGACVSPAPAACDACATAQRAEATANQALATAQQALARASQMYQRTLVK
jgi:hypothetical protein